MKWGKVLLLTSMCCAVLITPALANGTLQWGTCSDPMALITDANNGSALVPVDSLVELWHVGGNSPLATARIGQGYLTPQDGRFVTNSGLANGSYSLQIRVYNVPDPYAANVESCVVIVGQDGRGTSGIDVLISTTSLPLEICYPSAQIPTGDFDPDQGGGCQVLSPLAVTLASFSAVALEDIVLIQWETVSEIGNRGFNLYRGMTPTEPDRQLNLHLIPSQSSGSPTGFVYTWEDRADLVASQTYYYWLEDVDVHGGVTVHGPVSVLFGTPTAVGLASLAAQPAGAASGGLAVALMALASMVLAAWTRRNHP